MVISNNKKSIEIHVSYSTAEGCLFKHLVQERINMDKNLPKIIINCMQMKFNFLILTVLKCS